MSVKFCQHVKVDATLCQVPPLDGRHYCHFHLETHGRRARMARARARREKYHLVLPILEDLNSVEVARQQVMDAFNADLITRKHAGVLLFGLQGIAGDLRSAAPPRLGVYDPAIDTAPRATGYPGFEEKFGVPPDIDLSQAPEVLLAAEAAITQAAPSPYRDELFMHEHFAPEDIELEEVLKNEGEDAYQQRVHELNRKAMQKINQRRREIKRAQYILEAARRNTDIICGTPEERERVKAEIEKERAEAVAKRRAEMEASHTALRAGGQISPTTGIGPAAASEAGQPPFSAVSADGIVGMGRVPSAETSELGKKPSATVSGQEADPEAAHKQQLARDLAALKQKIRALG